MELTMIGLGRMGLNMCKRLVRDAHTVHAYDQSPAKVSEAVAAGTTGLSRLEELPRLPAPRIVWVMVPAGGPTSEVIERLAALLTADDLVIDGGNSYYKDSIERHKHLKARGVHFLDAGTSGGIWGVEEGYCLMIGGEKEPFRRAEPIFRSLAPKEGYALVGGPGAGHFTKMVHNGIEYGLMQAYAEGFELLRASGQQLDLQQIAHLWNQGSVVRSWLLELAERAFAQDPELESIQGYVEDTGEGRWTILEAMAHDVPAPVITLSLLTRFRSRQEESFQAKVLAALREQFGGHPVRRLASGSRRQS
jgi:6-phosphogluconate dehydrogenase